MSGRLEGQVAAHGGVARGWTLDVTGLGAVAAVVEEVEAELGPVTLLADAARIAADDLLTLRPREWPGP